MKAQWTIRFVSSASEKEVLELPPDLKARFFRMTELLVDFGPLSMGLPHVRPLGQGMWEMRLKGKDNIARSIYVLEQDREILVLHTFIKKTQKTPGASLALALKRLKEYKND